MIYQNTIPVPGLTSYSSQKKPQRVTGHRKYCSYNPQFRSDDPGTLVQNSSNHSYEHDKDCTCDGPNLEKDTSRPNRCHNDVTSLYSLADGCGQTTRNTVACPMF